MLKAEKIVGVIKRIDNNLSILPHYSNGKINIDIKLKRKEVGKKMAKDHGNNREEKLRSHIREFVNSGLDDKKKKAFKKWKKDYGDCCGKKKERDREYNLYLADELPEVIEWSLKYGYINNPETKRTQDAIYARLADPTFVKVLTKEIKRDTDFENIEFLPIVLREIIAKAAEFNAKAAEGTELDVSDIVELSKEIMKKKMKKFAKAGIDENLAFDVLSIIPNKESLRFSFKFRIRQFFDCLYEHSKGHVVPFKDVMEKIVSDEDYPAFIAYALLEKKERFSSLSEAEKDLYLQITNWCFELMEGYNKEVLFNILKKYISVRKNDFANGKDGARRYSLTSLSEKDYPRIAKAVSQLISESGDNKKYLD